MAQQKAVEPAIEEVDDLIDELQPGAKLLKGQYTITRYINSGGFGITYLAKDSLDRDVVIKECFPGSVCRRSKVVVAARSRAHTAELRSIVQLFVREARNLAKIVHPNIVAVHQVFEDNGTAYMAIDYIDGLDLQQVIDGEGPRLTPEHIVRVTEKLLHAVGFIHENDMLHRDISPDNVLIDKSGEPVLIDFGAAREQASKTNRAMSALRVVKDGYSPQEFYIAGSEQGPWSDLYALGATLYHLISDEAPVNGQARLSALAEDRPDPYLPLTGRFQNYPDGFLEAIDRALCTLPKQRLQTAREWLAMFKGGPVGVAAPEGVDDAVHQLVSDFNRATTTEKIVPRRTMVGGSAPLTKSESLPATSGAMSKVQLVAGMAVALVVLGVGYVMLNGPADPAAPDDADVAQVEPGVESAAVPTETAGANAIESATDPEVTAPATPETTAATETGTIEAIGAEPEAAAPETGGIVVEPAAAEPALAEPETTLVEPAPTETAPELATGAEVEPAVETATEPAAEIAADTAEEPTVEAAVETAEEAVIEPVAETAVEATVVPAVEPAEETVVETVVEPVAETAVETAEESAFATAVEIAPEAASQPEAAIEAEPEVAEVPAEVEPPAAPIGSPSKNQIALAAWDIEMPFATDNRIIGGENVAIVTQIPLTADLEEAGTWLQPGLLIYSVNGTPTPTGDAVILAILNALQVDPDGKARVVVEYAGSSPERTSGLLTVAALRLVNLENGVTIKIATVDGAWKTEVTGVAQPTLTTLRQGDVLFRDKTTTLPLDGPNTLEAIVADLVDRGVTQTSFSIIRDNKVSEATMQLVLDGGE